MSSSFSVGDPVTVERSDLRPLKGTVAYVGAVEFAEGSDWVGVRLEGDSVGHGKNDGSVKGVRYFGDCAEHGGVFVRKSALSKRTMTRLEELRARRQSKGGASSVVSKGRASIGGASSSTSKAAATPSPPVPDPQTLMMLQQTQKEVEELQEQNEALSEQNEELAAQQKSLQDELEELRDRMTSIRRESSPSADLASVLPSEEFVEGQDSLGGVDIGKDNDEPKKDDEETGALRAKLRSTSTQLTEALATITSLQTASQESAHKIASLEEELRTVESDRNALQSELSTVSEQNATHQATAQSGLRDRAKLQAEVATLKRRVVDLEREKEDTDATVEELALDKEQLTEEKEALEDALQEKLIDAEAAAIELEDLRLKLEETAEALENARQQTSSSSSSSFEERENSNNNDNDAQEVVEALSLQNARLREALVRLREQAAHEKLELTKEVRSLEKDASRAQELEVVVAALRESSQIYTAEIQELKETIDESDAYSALMEELSDKNIALEDSVVSLQNAVRALEEAGEVAAEMEEVQQEEISVLRTDLEERDTKVRQLEDAIGMQRQREEDFNRTILKYKSSIEKLQTEKSALLRVQEGGQKDTADLLASSQKALAQAAQMRTEAAQRRKVECVATFDRVRATTSGLLAEWVGGLLPSALVDEELPALQAEVAAVGVAELASAGLQRLQGRFTQSIRRARQDLGTDLMKAQPMQPMAEGDDNNHESDGSPHQSNDDKVVTLTDAAAQEIPHYLHETRAAMLTVEAWNQAVRILCHAQWPGVLDTEASSQFAASLRAPLDLVDAELTEVIRSLLTEGSLSLHSMDLKPMKKAVEGLVLLGQQRPTVTAQNEGDAPSDTSATSATPWEPPCGGWTTLCDVSTAKITCVGAAAVVACAISPASLSDGSSTYVPEHDGDSVLGRMLEMLEAVIAEAQMVQSRLAALTDDDEDESGGKALGPLARSWAESSKALLVRLEATLGTGASTTQRDLEACRADVEKVLAQISALSKSARILPSSERPALMVPTISTNNTNTPQRCWTQLTQVVQENTEEPMVGTLRRQAVEERLTSALEKEEELLVAQTKVSSLEKKLVSRAKEISLQNTRMVELEQLLLSREGTSETTDSASADKGNKSKKEKSSSKSKSSSDDESSILKKENTMLMEAMDVLQAQVAEHEKEIRQYKQQLMHQQLNSSHHSISNRAGSSKKAPKTRHSTSSAISVLDADFLAAAASKQDSAPPLAGATAQARVVSAEAALFRPALRAARREASVWRNAHLSRTISALPPLEVPMPVTSFDAPDSKSTNDIRDLDRCLGRLAEARTAARVAMASMTVVEVGEGARSRLRDSRRSRRALELRLDMAVAEARDQYAISSSSSTLDLSPSPTTITPSAGAGAGYQTKPLGRVHLGDRENHNTANRRVVPMLVGRNDLQSLHTSLLMVQ